MERQGNLVARLLPMNISLHGIMGVKSMNCAKVCQYKGVQSRFYKSSVGCSDGHLYTTGSVGNPWVRPKDYTLPIAALSPSESASSPDVGAMGAVGESRVVSTDTSISYPVYVCKLVVINNCYLACGEWDLCQHNWHAIWYHHLQFRLLNTEEHIEGVGEPFDVFDTCALHGAKIQHSAISRT
jgi:hypothetical protein